MTITKDKELCSTLCKEFGVERLIAALPQEEVKQVLGLVTIKELADDLEMNYDTLRTRMGKKEIPFPEVRLRRRAYYTRKEADDIKSQITGCVKKKDLPYKPRTG